MKCINCGTDYIRHYAAWRMHNNSHNVGAMVYQGAKQWTEPVCPNCDLTETDFLRQLKREIGNPTKKMDH